MVGKQMKRRILSVFLLLALVLPLLCACDPHNSGEDTVPDTTGTDETGAVSDDILLSEGGEASYVIVIPFRYQTYEQECAAALNNGLKNQWGVRFTIKTDFVSGTSESFKRQEKEIVLGACEGITDRSGELGDYDYLIRREEERIIVTAKSTYGYTAAFRELYSHIEKNEEGNMVYHSGSEILHRSGDEEVFFDVENKTDLIGICYSTWFNPIINGAKVVNGKPAPADISRILAGEQEWGGLYEFHYWGEPALGYYRSDDKAVIRTHMTQLAEAGIDYIIVDNTNASLSWKQSSYWNEMVDEPCTALLDVIAAMRAEGLDTPYVLMWCSTANGWDVVDEIYNRFYTKDKYKPLFVYWSGKPFFLTNSIPSEKRNDIVFRRQWGLMSEAETKSTWSFLNTDPSFVTYGANGKPEQVCVNVAHQQTYMSLAETATGRRGGRTMWECWQTAFRVHPKFITITWWNEWAAQRFEDNKFVDNYNEEYSRDIEPMKGGHGDTYYQWMKQYIAAYKAGAECPRLVEADG